MWITSSGVEISTENGYIQLDKFYLGFVSECQEGIWQTFLSSKSSSAGKTVPQFLLGLNEIEVYDISPVSNV